MSTMFHQVGSDAIDLRSLLNWTVCKINATLFCIICEFYCVALQVHFNNGGAIPMKAVEDALQKSHNQLWHKQYVLIQFIHPTFNLAEDDFVACQAYLDIFWC